MALALTAASAPFRYLHRFTSLLAITAFLLLLGLSSSSLQAQSISRPWHVYLKDGNRWLADLRGGDGRHVDLDTALAGELRVPLRRLAAVRFPGQFHQSAPGLDQPPGSCSEHDSRENDARPIRRL